MSWICVTSIQERSSEINFLIILTYQLDSLRDQALNTHVKFLSDETKPGVGAQNILFQSLKYLVHSL